MIGNYIFFSFDIVITKESLQGSKKKKEKEKKRNNLQVDIINNFIISRKHHVQGSSWGLSHFISGDMTNLEGQDINDKH